MTHINVILSEGKIDGKAQRLDLCLARALATTQWPQTRTAVQRLIREGKVLVNNRLETEPDASVEGENVICEIDIPPPALADISAENIPLKVIYEDNDVIVIDKPAGLVVHPSAGHRTGTLAHALLAHCGDALSGIGGVARPGIVHRLDKDTSGLIIIAKNDAAHQALAAQFADRSLSRTYQAIVWGVPKSRQGTISTNIGRHPIMRQRQAVLEHGGRNAVTNWRMIQDFSPIASLVECELETGRTHQIRVHMAHICHPVVGDPLYGKNRRSETSKRFPAAAAFKRQALHAISLRFKHPRTGQVMRLRSALADDIATLRDDIKKLVKDGP